MIRACKMQERIANRKLCGSLFACISPPRYYMLYNVIRVVNDGSAISIIHKRQNLA